MQIIDLFKKLSAKELRELQNAITVLLKTKKDPLPVTIWDSNVTVRFKNVTRDIYTQSDGNVYYWHQLAQLTEKEFLLYRGIGKLVLREAKEHMTKRGLKFREEQ